MAGLLDFDFGGFLGNNSNALIGLGAGIARGGNINETVSSGLTGLMSGRQADQQRQQQGMVFQALVAEGLSPQQAALAVLHPEFGKGAVGSVFKDYQPFNNGQLYGSFDKRTGDTRVQGAAPKFETVPEGGTGGYATPPLPNAPQLPPSRPVGPMADPTAPIVPRAVPTIPQPPFTPPAPIVPPPMPPANARVGPPLVQGKDQSRVTAGSFLPVISSPPKAPPGSEWVDPKDTSKGQRFTSGSIAQTEAAGKLSDDFRADETVKKYRAVLPIIQSVRDAQGREGGAADLNIIYAMAQIFDPGSVVREAEQILGRRSGGPAESAQALISWAESGQSLTPKTRQRILTELESRVSKMEQQHNSAMKHYEGRARAIGVDPARALYLPSGSAGDGWSISPVK